MKKANLRTYNEFKDQNIYCSDCLETMKNKYVLTMEDKQIMSLIIKELSNKEIADKLNCINMRAPKISENQVSKRLSKLYEFFNVTGRLGLVIKLIKENILTSLGEIDLTEKLEIPRKLKNKDEIKRGDVLLGNKVALGRK